MKNQRGAVTNRVFTTLYEAGELAVSIDTLVRKTNMQRGSINYCLLNLLRQELVSRRRETFKENIGKWYYVYQLTPTGRDEAGKIALKTMEHGRVQ